VGVEKNNDLPLKYNNHFIALILKYMEL
jgi:hypothetical protein